jgi:hypothetical protein
MGELDMDMNMDMCSQGQDLADVPLPFLPKKAIAYGGDLLNN